MGEKIIFQWFCILSHRFWVPRETCLLLANLWHFLIKFVFALKTLIFFFLLWK